MWVTRLRDGGFEGDLVSEGFELADEPTFACLLTIDAAGEVVRTEVAVGAGFGQHMPNDHNQGVGGRGGGLTPSGLAEPAVEAPELGADVGTGTRGGPGALGENRAQLGVALASPARAVFAGGFVV